MFGMCICCINFLFFLLLNTCLNSHQESLTEVEEKYKKAMVSNAQLDNDKGNLIYQVDTLKDVIEEMEEQMAEMKRELDDKSKVRRDIRVDFGFPKSTRAPVEGRVCRFRI